MSILAAAAISLAMLQNVSTDFAQREATRLDACIARIDEDPDEAWLVAGAPEAAVVTLTNALKIMPDDANLLVDRASAQILLEKWPEAIKDLDKALSASPGLAAAHQLRAEARLNMNDLEPALADVKAAMAAEPDNIDTLVLRGRIREAIRLSEVRMVPPQTE